jgi:hypothetical protein
MCKIYSIMKKVIMERMATLNAKNDNFKLEGGNN